MVGRQSEEEINLNDFKLGDQYIDMLSNGLSMTPRYKKFQLTNNRMTERGAQNLLPIISPNANELHLKSNRIGLKGLKILQNALINPRQQLIHINLEDNELGNAAMSGFLADACHS